MKGFTWFTTVLHGRLGGDGLENERGSVLVLAALATTAVMGFAAISIDAGRMFTVRQKLVDISDAAALAASQDLPYDPVAAEAAARLYLQRNGVDPATATISITHSNSRVSVSLSNPVDMTFARVLNVNNVDVGARSAIQVGNTSSATGCQPFGVETQAFAYGQTYDIKLDGGASGANCGNFHAIALGGTGACNYRHNIIDGYDGIIRVGDEIDTEPGNMSGPTKQGIRERYDADPCATFETVDSDSPRMLIVPIVTPFTGCNGRDKVRVIGFGAFFLEERCVTSKIRGRFMKLLMPGEFSEQAMDTGLRSVRFLPPGS
ncbi:MAG: pilus assembly protein [Firmicutes bacterium]|nr:pilus assembly protein [Bacillota bacterium]